MNPTTVSGGGRGYLLDISAEGRAQTEVANTVANRPAGYTVYQSRVVVGTSSTTLVAARANRQDLRLLNLDDTETVYVMFDGATATTDGWPLPPGGEFRAGSFRSASAVKAIVASGDATVAVLDMA